MNTSRIRPSRAIALAALAALAPSCDGTEPGRVPVHPARGRVASGGRPIADALVVLYREGAPPGGGDVPNPTGRTDADGAFTLRTYVGGDGAPEGKYNVSVSIAPAAGESADIMKNAATTTKKAPRPKLAAIDAKYGNASTSGLRAEIKPGENVLDPFEVK